MIHLASLVDPDAVRAINLEFLRRGVDYVVADPDLDDRRTIEEAIRNVDVRRISSLLAAIPPFREEHAELAWGHFMAAAVGVQLWPDANHRTALLTFDAAMQAVLGESVALQIVDAEALLKGSKEILHERTRLPGQEVFTLEETSDPTHPLRQHFQSFASRLIWTKAP